MAYETTDMLFPDGMLSDGACRLPCEKFLKRIIRSMLIVYQIYTPTYLQKSRF